LALVGTKFTNQLEGDDDANVLLSAHSKDHLVGKGGADHYMIGLEQRDITINNYDDGRLTDGDLAEDILLLPWQFKNTRLTREGEDMVLSHRHVPAYTPAFVCLILCNIHIIAISGCKMKIRYCSR